MKNGNGALTPMPLPRPAIEPNLSFDRATALAGTVATPFLVLSASRIQQSIQTLRSSLPGVQQDDALPLLLTARDAGLNVRGIAFHVGSQSLDPGIYTRALRLVRGIFDQAAAAGLPLDTLDIGGGFPVMYRTPVPQMEEF